MQDKMEQQTKIKATCKKDIVTKIKNILGKEKRCETIPNQRIHR